MQQLEIQQLQEEQAMLAKNSSSSGLNKSSSSKLGSYSAPSDAASLASLHSLPSSRRNSNDAVDLWGEMEKMSITDRNSKASDEYV